MAGNGRMMRRLDRRNRRLPRLDAVEEILVVIAGLVEFHFAQLLRQGPVVAPLLIGAFKGPALDIYPTLGSNPFDAAAYLLVATGDDHRDVPGIAQLDAVFRGGVPHGILGWKLAKPFDFRRAGVVEVAPPMGDIAMMSDPVHQLAAAGVVVPPPVPMHP